MTRNHKDYDEQMQKSNQEVHFSLRAQIRVTAPPYHHQIRIGAYSIYNEGHLLVAALFL